MNSKKKFTPDPNLKLMGIVPIKDLKNKYEVLLEEGSPDYMYIIKLDMRRKK